MARRQSEILGLFTTPTQVRQMEQQQLAQQASAYSDPIARQLFTSGAQVAGGVGRLFGAMSPQEMEAQQLNQLMEDVPFDSTNQSGYYNTLAQRLIDQGMYSAGYQALELGKQAREAELSETELGIKQQELDIRLKKLNNPASLSIKEQGDLAKDFTPTSVKKAVAANDVGLLEYKADPTTSNYVVVNQQTGVDRNGQPIFEQILVDKNKVAELTGGQAVVPTSQLMSGQQTQPAIPSTSTNVEQNVITSQPISVAEPSTPRTEQEVAELPGVPGLNPEKNIEMRLDTLENVRAAGSLIEDVFNPAFDNVVGRTNIVTREAATTTGSALAPLVGRVKKGSQERGIAIAKQLGVNPTDKDLQVAIESAPTANDPPNVWRDWLENTYIPRLFLALDSRYGQNDPKAQQYKTEIRQQLLSAQASREVPTRTATTSRGTKYTVRSK